MLDNPAKADWVVNDFKCLPHGFVFYPRANKEPLEVFELGNDVALCGFRKFLWLLCGKWIRMVRNDAGRPIRRQ